MTKGAVPVKKGDVVSLSIADLTHQGEGVGRYEGFTLFVPSALPGDTVEAQVISTKKSYGRALLQRVLVPSTERISPRCPVADRCGGCQMQHWQYEAQLGWKRQMVRESFARLAALNVDVLPVLGMTEPWFYRNKGQFPVGSQGEIGFYSPRSHDIVSFDRCYVQPEPINRALEEIKAWYKESGIRPYDEKRHEGTLRHIVLRWAEDRQQLMLILVGRTATPAKPLELERLQQRLPELKVMAWNTNPNRTNAVFGHRTEVLTDQDSILADLGERVFELSPRSFFQTNSAQTKVLYDLVKEAVHSEGSSVIWDLHCGTGTIGIYAAETGHKVVGIEVIAEAVADARKNARRNGVDAEYICGRAEVEIQALAEKGDIADVVILDPPRKGCDEALLQMLVQIRVQKIVYVSCNPTTLARDAAFLVEHGYNLGPIQPVDMFPHTSHVECVVVLSR